MTNLLDNLPARSASECIRYKRGGTTYPEQRRWQCTRWRVVLVLMLATTLAACCGCLTSPGDASGDVTIYGENGRTPGKLQKPRAMAIDAEDRVYIVDMTGRIQVFNTDGEYSHGWRTPEIYHGKPSGLSIDNDGNLMVADTHYFRMLVYTPAGEMLKERTIGGVNGYAPGEFGFVTDCVQDSKGNYYIGEYGENDRIQKFTPEGEFVFQWGGHGSEPGQFLRPQNFTIDDHDRLWTVDAGNHRIQVFDATGDKPVSVSIYGEHGDEPGQLSFPYDLALDGKGHLYVCEYSNHRVQKFALNEKGDGIERCIGIWGRSGSRKGELYQPWAFALDSKGRVHVLDTYNHRVQRIDSDRAFKLDGE